MNYREILEDFVNNENTEYCYDWQGFDYEIILPCIEQLLKNENNLQSKIDKVNKILDKYATTNVEDYKKIMRFYKELRNVLKENK